MSSEIVTKGMINQLISNLTTQPSREKVLDVSYALLRWMAIDPNAGNKPQLLSPQTQKLKDYLAPAPKTVQPQLYRLSADSHHILVRFAVLKKLKKDYISQLVDNDPGLTSYQASSKGIIHIPGKLQYIPQQPYFIHFITTPDYDRLVVVANQFDQKRIVSFRTRLTQTQHNKIITAWQGIGTKSKSEFANQLWKSLDIREVNKQFYEQIKERFDALVNVMQSQYPDAKDIQIKQFTVRMIGRYIFCWFLKEKGILPAGLLEKDRISQTDNYYQNVLKILFFNILNTKVEERKTSDKLFAKIPYLNGELFKEDEQFAGMNVNPWLEQFVVILESYDFTVDESSSQYQQVAVDPEMLGRIFENLLASQNEETSSIANQRKLFGAFYTPREIVDYMVNESIKAYLHTQLDKSMSHDTVPEPAHRSTIGDLFDHSASQLTITSNELIPSPTQKDTLESLFQAKPSASGFSPKDKKTILAFLENIKILDPACGSGAFPMGILHKLVELHELLGTTKSPYDLKKELLSQNIFGVDIMPMAIEIARLRAWLSLVLEENFNPNDAKNNFGVKPLPNLDFKFVCADSLIDSGYEAFLEKFTKGAKSLIGHDPRITQLEAKINELERIRQAYYDTAGSPENRNQLRKEFDSTKEFIKTKFQSLRKSWNLEDFFTKIDDWNPFDDSLASTFFSPSWMFGISDGFDIVIGNPPYIQIQNFSGQQKQKDWEKQKYATYVKTGDVYCLFYERGYGFLKKEGVLTFITSNKWMRANYGKALRQFFVENGRLLQLIDFGDSRIFENATTYTNILLWSKQAAPHPVKTWNLSQSYGDDKTLPDMLTAQGESDSLFQPEAFVIVKPEYTAIKRSIEAVGVPLKKWDITIYRGILTGLNEAFIIDGKKKAELIAQDPRSAEILKPILRGRDIKRYKEEFANLWLIATFPALKIDIENYPAIKAYLKTFCQRIFQTGEAGSRKKTCNKWFEVQDTIAYYPEFEKEKIMYAEIVFDSAFYYDANNYFPEATTFTITGLCLKYLVAILNSKLLTYSFKTFYAGGDLRGNTFRYKKAFIENLPLPQINENRQRPFEILVDCVQFARANQHDVEAALFESVIDGLVYDLYFAEEMKAAHCFITDRISEVVEPFSLDDTDAYKLEYIATLCKFCRQDAVVSHGLNHRHTIKPVEIIMGA